MAEPHATRTSLFASLRTHTTRRTLVLSVGAVVVGVGVAGSVSGSDDDDHDDNHGSDHDDDRERDDDDIRPSGTVPAGSAEVVIDDDDADGFEPGSITIDMGQAVTWVNLDDDPHTATGLGFDTGVIRPGELATVTFEEPGVFPYSCTIHPIMTGTVEVRDASGNVPVRASADAATPGATPAATPQVRGTSRAEVGIDDVAFSPAELRVTAGTTVVWTNHEAVPHTVSAANDEFDSGIMELSDTFEWTFESEGVFDYICKVHPSMEGRVIVEA